MLLIMGLPATGKTFVAERLASITGAVHLNTDMIRREQGLLGQYDKAHKEMVYSHLFEALRSTLQKSDVIVDGTFSRAQHRVTCFAIARASNARIRVIEMRAQEVTIRKRMQNQRKYSEADFGVYLKLRETFDSLALTRLVVYTDLTTAEEMLLHILPYINVDDD